MKSLRVIKEEEAQRPAPRGRDDLYKEALARQQRHRDLKEGAEKARLREQKQRLLEYSQAMKERRRLYQVKDTRTHLEREAEHLKKREESKKKIEAEKQAQEEEELKECTFKPALIRRSEGHGRAKPQRLSQGSEDPSTASLQRLAERQRAATASLQELAAEEARVREELRGVHAQIYERVQQEETRRTVAVLQDAGGPVHRGLAQRVRAAAAAGSGPQSMQCIVGELVGSSKEEVQRRVQEVFQPLQLEAEGGLYTRRLALVHELEAVEAQACALRGGALVEKAQALGLEFGLAEHARGCLPAGPRPAAASPRAEARPAARPPQQQPQGTPRSPGLECQFSPEVMSGSPVRRRLDFPETTSPLIDDTLLRRPDVGRPASCQAFAAA